MSKSSNSLLNIAAICAVAGPALLLTSDLFLIATGRTFEWTLGLWVAFLLLIPAVIGFTHYLVERGSQAAYIGGGLALFGAMAGGSMQVLFRVQAVLIEQGNTQAVEQIRGTLKLIATTQMIGLTWPTGLLTLAVSNYLVDRSRWGISLLLAVGAVAFPIGRIAGSRFAIVLSGAMFVLAFYLISRLLSSRSTAMA